MITLLTWVEERLLAGLTYKPRRLVTDGLRSYGVAHRELLPEARHRTSRYLNNRAEGSVSVRIKPDVVMQRPSYAYAALRIASVAVARRR